MTDNKKRFLVSDHVQKTLRFHCGIPSSGKQSQETNSFQKMYKRNRFKKCWQYTRERHGKARDILGLTELN